MSLHGNCPESDEIVHWIWRQREYVASRVHKLEGEAVCTSLCICTFRKSSEVTTALAVDRYATTNSACKCTQRVSRFGVDRRQALTPSRGPDICAESGRPKSGVT